MVTTILGACEKYNRSTRIVYACFRILPSVRGRRTRWTPGSLLTSNLYRFQCDCNWNRFQPQRACVRLLACSSFHSIRTCCSRTKYVACVLSLACVLPTGQVSKSFSVFRSREIVHEEIDSGACVRAQLRKSQEKIRCVGENSSRSHSWLEDGNESNDDIGNGKH